jgi:DNA-binding CsgD family transcriptional regulator
MVYGADGLIERERELGLVTAALNAAAGGAGRLVVVHGDAGVGKSSLLDAGCVRGRERGFGVLACAAGEFERELAFGVVRQLFESTLRGLTVGERRVVLAGAAGLARPLLLPSAGRAPTEAVEPAALMHGLYWLAANLSERRPLLLCVDDLQWCDSASLGSLLYFARRLRDLSVFVLLAVRSGEPRSQGGALAALADSDLGERMELAPLSERGSARIVRGGLVATADDELCRACFEVTGGNPFLLRELVWALRAEAPVPSPGLPDRVRGLTPRAVSRYVVARLGRLPAEATALARGLVVLGGRAELSVLLAVTGINERAGMAAVDALDREQIASGRPLRFVHPLVATAIYGEIPRATRALEHARVARVLATHDAAAGHVASHLLHAEPARDPWVVATLRRAARDARRDGAPDAAVRWLTRALAEPPPAEERALVLHELGVAELLAGSVQDATESPAERHLAEAVAGARDARAKGLAALDWGDALWAAHRYREAVRAFDSGIEAVAEDDSELALRIEAHAAAAARLDLGTCGLVSRRLERFGHVPPATPAGRLIAGVLAIDRALRGDPADQVVALAERMLEGGHLPSGQIGAQIPLFATNALLWSDHLEIASELLDEMIAAARAAGSVRGVIIALCWRGEAARRRGALADAASDLATAVELAAEHRSGPTAVTRALLAEALLERGDLDGAERALAPIAPPDKLPDYIGWNYVLFARGALHAARLDARAALEDFRACGARQRRWAAHNPSVLPWRSHAALARVALGDRAAARRLAAEELSLAQRFGAPRAIGIALRALALAERGESQIALLREAVGVLERSEATLERARALADLGGVLRRTNQRAAAREPLREALELATRCAAAPLTARVRSELLATGARARKPIRTGVDALTPIERQAANMAARGIANPQIAQALFISRKTVEKRLSEAYRKLAISSRDQLADALVPPDLEPPSLQVEGASP